MDKEQFNQLATPTTPSISDLVQNVYEVRNVLFTAYPFLGLYGGAWGVHVVLGSVHVACMGRECSAM